jgi:DNA-binding response OmpR family regulator
MVAEDEPNIVISLSFLMQRAGFDVRTAPDGPTALRMITAAPPDLLLLDIMLPGCSGFDVLAVVRQRRDLQAMRIIILTAKGSEVDRARGLQLGVDDYITKPFSNRDVLARVHTLLALTAP